MKHILKTYGKRVQIFIILCMSVILFTGCSSSETKREKIRDIEFTVVPNEETPEELKTLIEEKKQGEFKLTYKTAEYLYIIRGYGEQTTGGYSISVNECYLTSNAVYFKTNLIGPDKSKEIPEASSYPFVVIKIDNLEMSVVFQ